MASDTFRRKLTAILSADVKGYSRLMDDDEEATVHTLKAYREVIGSHVQEHQGRVVDSPGDNILAQFTSVVDAVRCAVDVQEELKARNDELPGNRRMAFRIGINLGDVIEDEDRIYGDGINIAARIEGLADAGGVCISGTVHEHIRNKLALGYESLGEHNVKNITAPVRVYRVLTEPQTVGKKVSAKGARPGRRRVSALVVFLVLVLIGAGLAAWRLYFAPVPGSLDLLSRDRVVIPRTVKASVAVLPFNNLSNDPEQEYFSDGITNDIITDLSKFRDLFVIASNTVFTFKGKSVKVSEVARDLGVRYVLEGSVQKAADRVRINAQLIDAATGHHLWAERFDRALKDIFAVQDEIVQRIVTTLAIKIDAAERSRVLRKETESLEAYDFALRGKEYLLRQTRSANMEARRMFERAIERDPQYATAYAALGWSYLFALGSGWTEFPAQALQKALDLAQKALSLDESTAFAHAVLGTAYLYRGQHDLATSNLLRAIELNPNDARSYGFLGWVMLWSGKTEDAIQALETSLRFDPNTSAGDFGSLGLAYYLKGRFDDAIRILERGVDRRPDFVSLHIALAATYARSGRSEAAAREAATVLRLNPFFEVDSYGTALRNPADRAAIADGLRKAGLK